MYVSIIFLKDARVNNLIHFNIIKGQILKWKYACGKLPRILSVYIFLTQARLNNLISNKITGLKIKKWKCACGSSSVQDYLEAAFLKDEYQIKS